jgi:anti-sigma B factor antagonist
MEIMVKAGKGRGKRKSRNVAIGGAMTIYGAAAAKQPLLDALDGAAELQVDLSEVVEMDTAGAQLLVLLKREADSADKRVVLSGHSPAVLEVFDCYRLAAFFGAAVAVRKEKR